MPTSSSGSSGTSNTKPETIITTEKKITSISASSTTTVVTTTVPTGKEGKEGKEVTVSKKKDVSQSRQKRFHRLFQHVDQNEEIIDCEYATMTKMFEIGLSVAVFGLIR